MSQYTLLGISGSLRKGATNRKLLREGARLFGNATYSEADLNLPLYNGDHETAAGIPDMVQTLADQIADADAVLISTPEYNKSLSGVLKNALDWVSRTDGKPFTGKPVAIMSAAAGRSGGVNSQAALRLCLVSFRPVLVTGPEMALANSGNAFDDAGQLQDAQYIKAMTELMAGLRAGIETANTRS